MGIFGRTRADDGMAPASAFTARNRAGRDTDELIGLCRGILADGAVSTAEAKFLLRWLESNRLVSNEFPFNVLYPRVARAMQDGVLDETEERELLELLMQATGQVIDPRVASSGSSELMLDDPAPDIVHRDRSFVVTGVFNVGNRREVTRLLEDRGGTVAGNVSRKVDYLIVGNLGSEDWKHSTHGTKILKALEIRELGIPIAIVSEGHWLRFAFS
jgi:NAD-dependent DNA ligase